MQIDKDTQILIDERLKNNAPASLSSGGSSDYN